MQEMTGSTITRAAMSEGEEVFQLDPGTVTVDGREYRTRTRRVADRMTLVSMFPVAPTPEDDAQCAAALDILLGAAARVMEREKAARAHP